MIVKRVNAEEGKSKNRTVCISKIINDLIQAKVFDYDMIGN